jgi:hypothetical protein
MQILTLAIEDKLVDQVMVMLKHFSQEEVRVVALQPADLFAQTAGILNHQIADPVEWQVSVRDQEW